MKKFLLLYLALAISHSGLAAVARLQVDTKTHVLTAEDGGTIIDATGVTLTLGGVTISDASGVKTIVLGSTSGTKIGDTGNKVGFLGATPVVRQTGNILSALTAYGLVASPSLTIANVTSLQSSLDNKANAATTINGHPISVNVTVTKGDVGLPLADNTSDANKPVSTAQQTALDLKSNLAGTNTFTGANNFTGANTFTPVQTFNSIASSSVVTSALANPGAPTVTALGTHAATTWTYKIVAKLSDGTPSAAGSAGSVTNGDDVLDSTNKNSLTWTAVTGAASYDVYRTVVGVSPSTTGKIANVTSPAYIDTGAAGDSATPPATNSTGYVRGHLRYSDVVDRPSITFEDFGAVGDGVTDDLAACQAAINASTATGANIVSNNKSYALSGPLLVYGSYLRILGTGSMFVSTSASASAVKFGDDTHQASYCEIKGFAFQPSVTKNTGVYEIDVPNGTNVRVADCRFTGIWGGIRLGTTARLQAVAYINNIRAYNFHQLLYLVRYMDAFVDTISSDSQQSDALELILEGGTEGCSFSNIDFTGGGETSLTIRATDYAVSPPRFNKFSQVYFDGGHNGLIASAGDTNSFQNCWFSNRPGSGVTIQGSAANTRFDNCEAWTCATNGFRVDGGTNTVFSNCHARANVGNGFSIGNSVTGGVSIQGGSSDGNQSNVFIGTGVTNVTVNGLRFGTSTVANITSGSPNSTTVAIIAPQTSTGTPLSIGAYDTATTDRGLYGGVISNIPSWLLADGTASHNWQTENNGGVLRWLLAGSPMATLSGTGFTSNGTTTANGNLIVNAPIYGQAASGNGDVLMVGNDAKIADVGIAQTLGIYGQSNPAIGGIELGSGGPRLSGTAGALTITGTETVSGTLTVVGTSSLQVEGWIAPTLQNSWVNYLGGWEPVGYRKNSFGVVELKGMIKNGTATVGTVLFTLPVGYRPPSHTLVRGTSNSTLLSIQVDASTGDVKLDTAGSSTYISLSGISFPTN